MTQAHQTSPWEWALDARRVLTLPAAEQPRWLQVADGRVWLTQTGAGVQGQDIWLGTGERLALPAGSEWVVEAWPRARLALHQPPPRPVRRARQWWRRP